MKRFGAGGWTQQWCKPCEQQIWRRSPDQSRFDWTPDRRTSVCKLASRFCTLPDTRERRRSIFLHFSSRSVFGSSFPDSSAWSLHQWLQGGLHCQEGAPGWTWFLGTERILLYNLARKTTWNRVPTFLPLCSGGWDTHINFFRCASISWTGFVLP